MYDVRRLSFAAFQGFSDSPSLPSHPVKYEDETEHETGGLAEAHHGWRTYAPLARIKATIHACPHAACPEEMYERVEKTGDGIARHAD